MKPVSKINAGDCLSQEIVFPNGMLIIVVDVLKLTKKSAYSRVYISEILNGTQIAPLASFMLLHRLCTLRSKFSIPSKTSHPLTATIIQTIKANRSKPKLVNLKKSFTKGSLLKSVTSIRKYDGVSSDQILELPKYYEVMKEHSFEKLLLYEAVAWDLDSVRIPLIDVIEAKLGIE